MTELRKIDVAAGKDTAGPAFAVGQSLAPPLTAYRGLCQRLLIIDELRLRPAAFAVVVGSCR
jgi:hypothetical protein